MHDPFDIAQSLFGIADMAIHMARDAEPQGDGEWQALPAAPEARSPFVAPALKGVAELERALGEANWYPSNEAYGKAARDHWTFGTAEVLRAPIRSIRDGYLEPVLRIPLVEHMPDLVVLYLISLDRGDDYLDREMHDVTGWHYHYLSAKKERSDVILSWDTRWPEPDPDIKPRPIRGLFAEKHGEGRARFSARPSNWREKKRRSMYEACARDLAKWPIDKFRCASNKSEVVYPPGFTLTPRP